MNFNNDNNTADNNFGTNLEGGNEMNNTTANVDMTPEGLERIKALYTASMEKSLEYVDMLMDYEGYHGQQEWNSIAPARATEVSEPDNGLSKGQISLLLEKEERSMTIYVEFVASKFNISTEAVTQFMNE